MAAALQGLLARLAAEPWVVASLDELATSSLHEGVLAPTLRRALQPAPAHGDDGDQDAGGGCEADARSVLAGLWASARCGAGWTSPLQREAFVLACCAAAAHGMWPRAVDDDSGGGAAAAAALRDLDVAFVMGGPADLLQPFVDIVEPLVPRCRPWAAPEAASRPAPFAPLGAPHGPVASAPGSLPPTEFRRTFFRSDAAVVLRGAVAGWPALARWRSPDYWVAAFGHRTVPLELGVPGSAGWREEVDTVEGLFRRMLAPAVPGGDSAPAAAAPEPAYLAQHTLFDQLPGLAGDAPPPAVADPGQRGGLRVARTNAWLGSAGTVTPLHYDSYDGLLCQAVGRKLVRLYGPEQTSRLYPAPSGWGLQRRWPGRGEGGAEGGGGGGGDGGGGGTAAAAAPAGADGGGAVAAAAAAGRRPAAAAGTISLVDVEAPDLGRFPLFAAAVCSEVLLEPGDVLYIPGGVWHWVKALEWSASVSFVL